MRLWSLHPSYLDTKGLTAVWREGLLALHVLSGKTKGYTKHPQLLRFREHAFPIDAINAYLHEIVDEADQRGYHFDRKKLSDRKLTELIPLTQGQLEYEVTHLKKKLKIRDIKKFELLNSLTTFKNHSSFKLTDGSVAPWEKV